MSGARPMFYLVQRESVYGRGIVGIFTTEPKAVGAALDAAREEPHSCHDYHEFVCYQLQSDMRVTLAYSAGDPTVFVLRRQNVEGELQPQWVFERPPAP